MKRLPEDLKVRELVEAHAAVAPLDMKRSALEPEQQLELDRIANKWLQRLHLENEAWATGFANGDGLHTWRREFVHFNDDGSHHFETDLDTYLEIAERNFLAGYLFTHAWDVFAGDQAGRFLATGIPVHIAEDATALFANTWNARKSLEVPGLHSLGDTYWLPQAHSLYMPIGRDAIYQELNVSRIASTMTVDGEPVGNFPYSTTDLERFADTWALGTGDAFAVFAIPMRFAHSTAHIFPIAKSYGLDVWAGRNNLRFTGDVHIHLEGNANHPDLPNVVKRIERWVKRFAGKPVGTTHLTIASIKQYVSQYRKDKGKYPTKIQASSDLLSGAGTAQALDYHLGILGIGWKDVWRG